MEITLEKSLKVFKLQDSVNYEKQLASWTNSNRILQNIISPVKNCLNMIQNLTGYLVLVSFCLHEQIFGSPFWIMELNGGIQISSSCHLDSVLNVEIGFGSQIFVIAIFFHFGQVLQFGAHSRYHKGVLTQKRSNFWCFVLLSDLIFMTAEKIKTNVQN